MTDGALRPNAVAELGVDVHDSTGLVRTSADAHDRRGADMRQQVDGVRAGIVQDDRRRNRCAVTPPTLLDEERESDFLDALPRTGGSGRNRRDIAG